jgi:release factor glutamine methyltransferase
MLAGVLREHAPGAAVLDLCTGSGVLAVSAALAGARSITAVDVSRRAVATARLNGLLNGVCIRTRRGNLLDAVPGERFDVIVANPPYLPAVEDDPRGLLRATEAGPDGRLFVDRLIDRAPDHLEPGGVLLVVHSSVNGVEPSLERIERSGMEPDLAATHHGPLGPILTDRARFLEERGLLAPGEREEDVVVVRGRVPIATI